MRDRIAAKVFPLLHPTDLRGEEEQRDAEQVNLLFQQMVGYADCSLCIKCESYIKSKEQEYFESNPEDAVTSMEEQRARWTLQVYYKHKLKFIF